MENPFSFCGSACEPRSRPASHDGPGPAARMAVKDARCVRAAERSSAARSLTATAAEGTSTWAGATRFILGRSRLTEVIDPFRCLHIIETIPCLLNEFTHIEAEVGIRLVRSSARGRLLLDYKENGCAESGQTVDRSGTAPSSPRDSEKIPLTYEEAPKTEKLNDFPAILSITGVSAPS